MVYSSFELRHSRAVHMGVFRLLKVYVYIKLKSIYLYVHNYIHEM